jgi:hypothetical protein
MCNVAAAEWGGKLLINTGTTAASAAQVVLSQAVNSYAPTGLGKVIAKTFSGAALASLSGHDAVSGAIGAAMISFTPISRSLDLSQI